MKMFLWGGERMWRSSSIVYAVQPGDTLYSIARRYDTTIEEIMMLNGLTSTELTVGQRLKIPLYTEVVIHVDAANIRKGPGTYYPVIAQMTKNARLPEIGAWKDWKKVKLYDNRKGWVQKDLVKEYIHDGERPIISNLGFYTLEEGPALPSSYDSFVNNTPALSELGMFLFQINKDNPTEIVKFGDFTDEYVKEIVDIAHKQNIKILPVVHNLLYEKGNTKISKDVVKTLVSNEQNRQAFIQNVINLIEKYDFDGVNIDIEDVYLEDSENLSALYTELGEALREKGYYLSGSIPARVSDDPFNPFSDPFDYEAIGKAVDEFVVMLYNEHGWPGSGPGPVVSIGWMDRVLNYTKTKMPEEKIVGATSVFGFDFNLTTGKNTYVTYDMAMELADKYNKEIVFDEKTQTPMFAYVDEEGNQHEVWFENRDSIYAKAKKAWDLGVKGLALWRLGMEDPNIWPMLREDVVIKRE